MDPSLPQNISVRCEVPELTAASRFRPWTPAMTAFLRAKRREGRTMRWIAAHLGVTFGRAVAKAVRLRLILYVPRTYVAAQRLPGEPEPLGNTREVVEEGRCRWIGEDMTTAWRMCGHLTAKGERWCPHHRARVFVDPIDLEGPRP